MYKTCIMEDNQLNLSEYEKHYSDEGFWTKVKKFALKAGAAIVYNALKLHFALKRKETPAWAKTVIYGALGYFILPLDLVPDLMPGVGFADDGAALAAALLTVAAHITPEVKSDAKAKLQEWFGPEAATKIGAGE